MESLANYLHDDYEAVAAEALLDAYGRAAFDVEAAADDEGMRNLTLTGSFANRDGLDELLDDVADFLAYADERCDASDLAVAVSFESPDTYLESVGNDFVWALPTDVNATFRTSESPDEQIAAAEDEYLAACIDYRLDDRLSAFSDSEIERVVSASEHQLQVNYPDGSSATYDDLLGGSNWNVSLGTLYEVLEREGFSPTGTGAHFSFVGADGCTYEFCSDFQGAATSLTTQRDYYWRRLDEPRAIDRGYFLRDGEAYPLLNTCSRVDYRTVKCATGLELFDEWSLGTKYTWDISDYDVS